MHIHLASYDMQCGNGEELCGARLDDDFCLHAVPTTQGMLSCWGDDAMLQISNAPTTGTFTSVSVGYYSACAISSTQSVICWGNNGRQQVSNAPTTCTFTSVSSGSFAACAN